VNIWEVSPQISTPEEVSKIVKKLRKLDVSKMEDHVLELPVQIKSAFETALKYDEGDMPLSRDKVHLIGLGGSAIAGDLIGDMLENPNKVIVHRGSIPPRDTRGVIVSSYSGSTREIIQIADQVYGGLRSNVYISSGGELTRMAWEQSIPIWRIPTGYQPRAALGWALGLAISLMVRWDIVLPKQVEKLEKAATRLAVSLDKDEPTEHPLIRAALPISTTIKGKSVIVFYSKACTGIATRLSAQLNENSNHPAFQIEIPEGLHNAVEGLINLDHKKWAMIFLADPNDSPDLRETFSIAAEYFYEKGFACLPFPAAGSDQFELTLSRIVLADYVSLFLAALKGNDPTELKVIPEIKLRGEPPKSEPDPEPDPEPESNSVSTDEPDPEMESKKDVEPWIPPDDLDENFNQDIGSENSEQPKSNE